MKLENKCYWHEWARKKAKETTAQEVLDSKSIYKCYTCKGEQLNKCFLDNFYSK